MRKLLIPAVAALALGIMTTASFATAPAAAEAQAGYEVNPKTLEVRENGTVIGHLKKDSAGNLVTDEAGKVKVFPLTPAAQAPKPSGTRASVDVWGSGNAGGLVRRSSTFDHIDRSFSSTSGESLFVASGTKLNPEVAGILANAVYGNADAPVTGPSSGCAANMDATAAETIASIVSATKGDDDRSANDRMADIMQDAIRSGMAVTGENIQAVAAYMGKSAKSQRGQEALRQEFVMELIRAGTMCEDGSGEQLANELANIAIPAPADEGSIPVE